MRVTGQSVPPAVQLLYDKLVTVNPATALDYQIARTRIAARKPRTQKRIATRFARLEAYADEIIRRQQPPIPESARAAFRYSRLLEMLNGLFNQTYWKYIQPTATNHLVNQPQNTIPATLPPFSYRDPNNLPSKVVYTDGVSHAGPPAYHGQTIAPHFEDVSLVWGRASFKLPAPMKTSTFEPLVFLIDGTQHIVTDVRASRPMLSALAKLYVGPEGSAFLSPLEAPVKKAFSFYRLYAIPSSLAPYYNATHIRHTQASAETRAKYAPAGPYDHATLTYSVRPMNGRGYNNNSTVDITLDDAKVALLQLRKTPPSSGPIACPDGVSIEQLDLSTGHWNEYYSLSNVQQIIMTAGSPIVLGDRDAVYFYDIDWNLLDQKDLNIDMQNGPVTICRAASGWDIAMDGLDDFGIALVQHVDPDHTIHPYVSHPDSSPLTRGWAKANYLSPNGNYFWLSRFSAIEWFTNTRAGAGYTYMPTGYQRAVASGDAIYVICGANTIQRLPYPATLTTADFGNPQGAFSFFITLPHTYAEISPADDGCVVWQYPYPTLHIASDGTITQYPTVAANFETSYCNSAMTIDL